MNIKLLDLFCGAGGSAEGYKRAGFYVRGVDIQPQPRYAGDEFIQCDALDYLQLLCASGEINEFSVIHASPPCQAYSRMRHVHKSKSYVMLVGDTQKMLASTGLLYVLENVEGAPIADMPLFSTYAITLCGNSFGLRVYRHRLFESNYRLIAPEHVPHTVRCSKQGRPNGPNQFLTVTGNFSGIDNAKVAMGINWMTKKELSQAIPPAYTEYIGNQLFAESRPQGK